MKNLTVIFITLFLSISIQVFAEIKILKYKNINGKSKGAEDVSSMIDLGNFLILGSDETNGIQIANKVATDTYEVGNFFPLASKKDGEIDIEALAHYPNQNRDKTIYVCGAHGISKKGSDNANRFKTFKVEVDSISGEIKSYTESSLKQIIENDKYLKKYVGTLPQENGVNIEGMAIDTQNLYFGFRSPIINEMAVVLVLNENNFSRSNKNTPYEIRFVDLGNLGIRDMIKVDKGFLILAGIVGEDTFNYYLYYWNGKDSKVGGISRLIGEIPNPASQKLEILTLIHNGPLNQVIVGADGSPNGGPFVISIPSF